MAMTFARSWASLLMRAVQVRRDHVATIDEKRVCKWGAVADRVARASVGLRSLGLTDGDRVAVLALTNDRNLELFAAVPHAAGVIVPLNWRWSVAELADVIKDPNRPCCSSMTACWKRAAHSRPVGMILSTITDVNIGLPPL